MGRKLVYNPRDINAPLADPPPKNLPMDFQASSKEWTASPR
jgi:hypothetical protein